MSRRKDQDERRDKIRFRIEQDVRYKLLRDGVVVAQGAGQTLDLSSSGVAFVVQHRLPVGAFVELSIGWPVLLDGKCPMRLIVLGRVVRASGCCTACTVDKYEFRTQGRRFGEGPVPIRTDARLLRWAEGIRTRPAEARSAASG